VISDHIQTVYKHEHSGSKGLIYKEIKRAPCRSRTYDPLIKSQKYYL